MLLRDRFDALFRSTHPKILSALLIKSFALDSSYSCDGKALAAFGYLDTDLNLLRSIVPVYTVCSHGNAPRQKHINYEVFIKDPGLYSRLRIEGEAYLTVFRMLRELKKSGVIRDYVYLSDTYRRDINWIDCLRNASRGEIIYILIHPDNWRN